jgi:ribosomal biogenesis protein LAS1
MQLDVAEFESSDMQETDSMPVNHSADIQISNSNTKTIIMKLTKEEPRLMLTVY